MKNLIIKKHFGDVLFLGIFSIFYYLFLKSSLLQGTMSENDAGINPTVVIVVFVLASSYVYFNSRFIVCDIIGKRLLALVLVTYLLSIFHTPSCPFPSNLLYISIPLPLVLYFFSYSISYKVNNYDTINIVYIILFVLLFRDHINIYQETFVFGNSFLSNSAYSLLFLMPFLLASKIKWIEYASIFIVMFSIIISLKRTGMISLLFATFLFIYISSKTTSFSKITWWLLSLIIIISLGYYIFTFTDSISNVSYSTRIENVVEDGGSGRTNNYSHVLTMIGDSPDINLIVGHGYNAVYKYNTRYHLSAHNELLEVLYDYGVIGLIFFIYLLWVLVKQAIRMVKRQSKYAPSFVASLAIFIINSSFSHTFLYSYNMSAFVLFWGVIHALENKERQLKTLSSNMGK